MRGLGPWFDNTMLCLILMFTAWESYRGIVADRDKEKKNKREKT